MFSKEGYLDIKPQIKSVCFPKRGKFQVDLQDGRIIVMPVSAFPSLKKVPTKERNNWFLIGGGVSWNSCSEVIHIEQILGSFQKYTHDLLVIDDTPCHNEIGEALGVGGNIQMELLNRLDTLKKSLSENWDSEGGLPIEDEAYNNVRDAISNTSGYLLRHWNLFPAPNGTLMLSPKDSCVAGISIGNTDFSYAAYVSDDKQVKGKERFTKEAFQVVLSHIHNLLGYA